MKYTSKNVSSASLNTSVIVGMSCSQYRIRLHLRKNASSLPLSAAEQ